MCLDPLRGGSPLQLVKAKCIFQNKNHGHLSAVRPDSEATICHFPKQRIDFLSSSRLLCPIHVSALVKCACCDVKHVRHISQKNLTNYVSEVQGDFKCFPAKNFWGNMWVNKPTSVPLVCKVQWKRTAELNSKKPVASYCCREVCMVPSAAI